VKSSDNICTILIILAPNTLRIPISFRRCCAEKETSPNKPKQEIKIAKMAKYKEGFPTIASDLYWASKELSKKV